jgi:hypothetical protein
MNDTAKLVITIVVIIGIAVGAIYVYRAVSTEYYAVKGEIKEGMVAKEKANFLSNTIGNVTGGFMGR